MRSRIEMTVSCRDTDAIPKVTNAGQVIEESDGRIQIMHNGIRVIAGAYHGGWMEEIIFRLRGHHEPQEELAFNEVLQHIEPRATMIEIGGFWSYYSLWFLRQNAVFRRAIVVEPDPNSLAVGRANALLNEAAITFVHAAASDCSAAASPFETETAGDVVVPRVTVAELMELHEVTGLDVLHCDAQGIETSIIRSCESLFRRGKIRFAVISTHAHQISGDPLTHQRCLAMLQGYGARILVEHDVHESYSGDGLIVAYSGEQPIQWPDIRISYNRYSTSLFPNPLHDLAAALGHPPLDLCGGDLD